MALALKVDSFGGMVPAVDSRLLPQDSAALSTNAYVINGALKGINTLTLLHTLVNPSAARVFRIPNNYTDAEHLADSTFLEFADADTDVLRTNVIGDQYDRFYAASSSGVPEYNTLARLQSGTNALILGVPAPTVAPGVSVSGGSANPESRAYVYTWETTYGEEGPPSPPTVLDSPPDGTWNITMSAAAANDTNGVNRLIAFTNIYRTITASNGTATYFFVAQVPVATLSYADTIDDTIVAANNELLSATWTGPPTDLQGWVAMPNGMMAGWDTENTIWFCEPYRPHAWPIQYAIAVQYPIIGMGVCGQTLVICTQGFPYWAYGVNPSVVSLSMIEAAEPCMSRASIVSAPEGVYYASPNGLILANNGTAVNVTNKLMKKDQWLNLVSVPTLRAARLGSMYYAWGAGQTGVFDLSTFDNVSFDQETLTGSFGGCCIDVEDRRIAFNLLSDTSAPTFDVDNDVWTGEVFVVRNGGLYWLNVADPNPTPTAYTWRSKSFEAPSKRNLGAVKVFFDIPPSLPPLNPTPNTSLVQTLQSGQYGLVRLYADGVLKWTRELRKSGELMKLPSGFKADYYQIEINAYVTVSNVQVAESAKDLAQAVMKSAIGTSLWQ